MPPAAENYLQGRGGINLLLSQMHDHLRSQTQALLQVIDSIHLNEKAAIHGPLSGGVGLSQAHHNSRFTSLLYGRQSCAIIDQLIKLLFMGMSYPACCE